MFAKLIKNIAIFVKNFIIDIWEDHKYNSVSGALF